MIEHKVCRNCCQRRNGPEFTSRCPAYPLNGHDWETRGGNGVKWNESYLGQLWNSKIGKILILAVLAYLFIKAFF